jgi:hypothetical protein
MLSGFDRFSIPMQHSSLYLAFIFIPKIVALYRAIQNSHVELLEDELMGGRFFPALSRWLKSPGRANVIKRMTGP